MHITCCVKVAVPGTRTVQPPPKWEMKCDWVTDTIPQCRVRGFYFPIGQIEWQRHKDKDKDISETIS